MRRHSLVPTRTVRLGGEPIGSVGAARRLKDGSYLLLDHGCLCLRHYSPTGEPLGRVGNAAGTLAKFPVSLAVSPVNQRAYIGDVMQRGIIAIDPPYDLASIHRPILDSSSAPLDLVATRDGHLLVAGLPQSSNDGAWVHRFDEAGSRVASALPPSTEPLPVLLRSAYGLNRGAIATFADGSCAFAAPDSSDLWFLTPALEVSRKARIPPPDGVRFPGESMPPPPENPRSMDPDEVKALAEGLDPRDRLFAIDDYLLLCYRRGRRLGGQLVPGFTPHHVVQIVTTEGSVIAHQELPGFILDVAEDGTIAVFEQPSGGGGPVIHEYRLERR